MAGCDLAQRRVEVDAGGVHGDALARRVGIGHGYRREEGPGVRVGGAFEDGLGRRELNDLPQVHDGHAVGDVSNQPQIVGDEQVRELEPLLEIHEQVDHLRLHRHVERRHRLVRDDERWVEGEGARDADPLPLTAAELVRKPAAVRWVQADDIEELLHPAPPLRTRPHAVDDQRFLDDVRGSHAWVQGRVRILEDDLHIPPRAPHAFPREA